MFELYESRLLVVESVSAFQVLQDFAPGESGHDRIEGCSALFELISFLRGGGIPPSFFLLFQVGVEGYRHNWI